MRVRSVIVGIAAFVLTVTSAAPARATDPCWYELSYSKTLALWQISNSSTAIGCASLMTVVDLFCANLVAQAAQRDGEIHCCSIDQSTSPLTSGMEPGWCRWPNG